MKFQYLKLFTVACTHAKEEGLKHSQAAMSAQRASASDLWNVLSTYNCAEGFWTCSALIELRAVLQHEAVMVLVRSSHFLF